METPAPINTKSHESSTYHRLTPSSKVHRTKRKYKKPGVIDLLVVVSGTTDPVNLIENKFAANWYYWEENLELRKKLAIYKKSYSDLHIFATFSWSGDNSVVIRRKAGEKLKNLIVKAYPKWKNREIALHFVGHSHGGNVINECTHFIAKDKNFPKKWSIRSISYLSTPFFSKYHTINKENFHKKCKIINVYNKYDLTQRVIADFSMLELTTLINEFFGKEASDISDKISEITNSDIGSFYYDKFVQAWLNEEEAIALWKHGIKDISWLKELIELIILKFNKLTFKTFKYTNKTTGLVSDRQLVSDDAYSQLKYLADDLITIINKSIYSLTNHLVKILSESSNTGNKAEAKILEKKYSNTPGNTKINIKKAAYFKSRSTFLDDLELFDIIDKLITIVAIRSPKSEYRSGVLNVLDKLIVNQLDDYDNTLTTPKHLLNGYPFENIDVTKYDPYNATKEGAKGNYDTFIKEIEVWEKKFESSKTQKLRMEFLFRLLTLTPYNSYIKTTSKWVNRVSWAIYTYQKPGFKSPLVKSLDKFVIAANDYSAIMDSFDRNAYHEKDDNILNDISYDLMYFMKVAHSVSRQDFYDEVQANFINQFESGKNPGYKPNPEQIPLVIIDGVTYYDKKECNTK